MQVITYHCLAIGFAAMTLKTEKSTHKTQRAQIIEFDKLITTDKLLKNAMREDGYLITNESFETSFDGYFAIGNAVKSNKSFSEQLEIVLDYIKGN